MIQADRRGEEEGGKREADEGVKSQSSDYKASWTVHLKVELASYSGAEGVYGGKLDGTRGKSEMGDYKIEVRDKSGTGGMKGVRYHTAYTRAEGGASLTVCTPSGDIWQHLRKVLVRPKEGPSCFIIRLEP